LVSLKTEHENARGFCVGVGLGTSLFLGEAEGFPPSRSITGQASILLRLRFGGREGEFAAAGSRGEKTSKSRFSGFLDYQNRPL